MIWSAMDANIYIYIYIYIYALPAQQGCTSEDAHTPVTAARAL